MHNTRDSCCTSNLHSPPLLAIQHSNTANVCTIYMTPGYLVARLGLPPLLPELNLLPLLLLLRLRRNLALPLAAARAALRARDGDVDIQLLPPLGLGVGARALALLVTLAHLAAHLGLEERAVGLVEEGELGGFDLRVSSRASRHSWDSIGHQGTVPGS